MNNRLTAALAAVAMVSEASAEDVRREDLKPEAVELLAEFSSLKPGVVEKQLTHGLDNGSTRHRLYHASDQIKASIIQPVAQPFTII